MKKRILGVFLSAVLSAAVLSGCAGTQKETAAPQTEAAATEAEAETEAEETTTEAETSTAAETTKAEETTAAAEEASESGDAIRIGAMSGPTAMGMVKLMDDAENGKTENTYAFADLATDASALGAPLVKGELDIAAIPSNLAANLYNNSKGGIQIAATVNNGVLYIVERGDSVSSIADLAGKEIYATGQGAVPEYTLRYLLSENGIDPDKDITINWCSDTTEALSKVGADENAIAMLPQPFVTAACAKVEGLHPAIDLNDEWEKLDNGCSIVTGVIAVRTAFAAEHPEQLETFLKEYEASVAYTADDAEGAAALIEKYGIVAKAAIAQKALPGCHLNCLTGADMKTAVEGFLKVLFDQNPKAVGGSMPGEDFYYGN